MKNLFTILVLSFLSIQLTYSQCGDATNPVYYFDSADDLVFDWDDNPSVDTFIFQFKDLADNWSFSYSDTVFSSQIAFPDVCSYDYTANWRIISICSSGRDTTIDLTAQFECLPPTSPTATNVLTNSALLHWIPVPHVGANCMGYALAYRVVGAPSWTSLGVVYNTSFQLNNLQPSTNYEWCVNQICIEDTSVPLIGQFNTQALPCLAPGIPSATSIGITNMNLSWSTTSGTPNHYLQYKPSSSSTWTTITVNTNNFYNLTGLTSNTAYDVRVARGCSATNVSPYSPIKTLVTNCISLNSSIEHIRYVKIHNTIWTSTASAGGYLFVNWNNAPVLTRGLSYTLRVAAGGQVNSNNLQDVAAYLDANNNNIFESTELVAGPGAHNNTNIRQYTFTVPTGAAVGSLRLRIVMLKQGQTSMSACPATGLRGEVEDYLVTIVAPPGSRPDKNVDNDFLVNENELQNSFTLKARCKDYVTKYMTPWECSARLSVDDLDDGSTGYDTLYYSGSTTPFIGEPNIYKLKAVTNEGDGDYCFSIVTFLDTVPPVAISEEKIVLGFFTTDSIPFSESMFDAGSYDYCTPVTITMDPPYVRITDPSPLNVKMTVTDTYGNTNTAYTLVEIVDKTSGSPTNTSDIANTISLITPNPAVDRISLSIDPKHINSIFISNSLGQVVMSVITNIQNEINISSLAEGQYSISIQHKNGELITSKLIKIQ